jgi:cyclophilin family peptidyl-prolyl cis-trans isomerase
MQGNKIIIPVILAILVCAGGYWLFTRNTGTTVQSADTQAQVQTQTQADTQTQASSTSVTSPKDNQKIMSATLHTSMGDITIEFRPNGTPNTVVNFIKLAQSGFYDGTKFHRVIKGFMDQGGDPLTKNDALKSQWGTGGPGYKFNDEIGPGNSNTAGTIAMANSGPNTAGSQFFINAVDNPNLNSGYTVFGKVTSGMDVVTAINNVPTDSSDRPRTPVVLESVAVK